MKAENCLCHCAFIVYLLHTCITFSSALKCIETERYWARVQKIFCIINERCQTVTIVPGLIFSNFKSLFFKLFITKLFLRKGNTHMRARTHAYTHHAHTHAQRARTQTYKHAHGQRSSARAYTHTEGKNKHVRAHAHTVIQTR